MPRRDELPTISPWFDAKLHYFLRTARFRAKDVFIDGDANSEITSLSKTIKVRFGELIKKEDTRIIGRIDAPDKMPLKRVIAVVNAFQEARIERVDFVGVERAPREVWTIEDLPR